MSFRNTGRYMKQDFRKGSIVSLQNPSLHSALKNLLWLEGGHMGGANKLAGFGDVATLNQAFEVPWNGSADNGDVVTHEADTRITPFRDANAPTVNDDISLGFEYGSLWQETTGNTLYMCFDPADGAAVWIHLNLKNTVAAAAPTVNDDAGDGYSRFSLWLNTTGPTFYMCADTTVGAAVWVII